jgi:hypothetical protein
MAEEYRKLTREELNELAGEELPERAAMSLINANEGQCRDERHAHDARGRRTPCGGSPHDDLRSCHRSEQQGSRRARRKILFLEERSYPAGRRLSEADMAIRDVAPLRTGAMSETDGLAGGRRLESEADMAVRDVAPLRTGAMSETDRFLGGRRLRC